MKKFIISEEERKHILGLYNLIEQKPESSYDRLAASQLAKSDEDYMERLKNVEASYNQEARKVDENSLTSIEWFLDTFTDIISAIFDGIPGMGNLVSGGIDIVHVLSYFARAYFSTDKKYQAECYYNGIVTGLLATIPFAGNVIILGFRGAISKYMNMQADELIKFLAGKGFRSQVNMPLPLGSFIFNWIAAIKSLIKDELGEYDTLVYCKDYLKKAREVMKDISTKFGLASYVILPLFSTYIKLIDSAIKFLEDEEEVLDDYIEKLKPTICNSPEDVGEYEGIVIVGTYGDYDNLVKREKEMKEKGYKIYNQCLDNGSTRLGVRIKYSDANDFETKFNKVKEFQSNAWVLKFSETAIGIKMTNQFKNLMKYITGN
jgi:hypothetical protein